MHPQIVAAIAFVSAIESSRVRRFGGATSAHVQGALQNLRDAKDLLSIKPNLDVVVEVLRQTVPEVWANASLSDHVRRDLCGELSTAGPDSVRAACKILEDYLGGDAQIYERTWGKIPP